MAGRTSKVSHDHPEAEEEVTVLVIQLRGKEITVRRIRPLEWICSQSWEMNDADSNPRGTAD